MLSTKYRLRLEAICKKIVLCEDVSLPDMIWAEKFAKSHTLASEIGYRKHEGNLLKILRKVLWMIL